MLYFFKPTCNQQIKAPLFGNNLLNNYMQIKAVNGWDSRGKILKVRAALKKNTHNWWMSSDNNSSSKVALIMENWKQKQLLQD